MKNVKKGGDGSDQQGQNPKMPWLPKLRKMGFKLAAIALVFQMILFTRFYMKIWAFKRICQMGSKTSFSHCC